MICKHCNGQIPGDAIFCPRCGTLIEEDLEATGLLMEDEGTGLLDEAEQPTAAIPELYMDIHPAFINPDYRQARQQTGPKRSASGSSKRWWRWW